MECIHLLESGCTYCSGKETTLETPKVPKREKRRPKRAPVSPEMVLAGKVARGEICEKCLTSTGVKYRHGRDGIDHIDHIGLGCQCSRRANYDAQLELTTSWLQDNTDGFIKPGATDEVRAIRDAEKVATGLAFSVQARMARRTGIVRDAVADDGTTPSCSEQQEERNTLLLGFGVDPKWHPARTQEADPIPV